MYVCRSLKAPVAILKSILDTCIRSCGFRITVYETVKAYLL